MSSVFLKISCFKRKKQATPCVSPIFSISGFSSCISTDLQFCNKRKKDSSRTWPPPGVPAEEACRKGFLLEKAGQTTGQLAKADRAIESKHH
ncbi:MAG: hypothetical protein QGH96_03905 [Desulfobacterales bacterium]|nr:hypothetical protein [Desulfobacterales bacterium]